MDLRHAPEGALQPLRIPENTVYVLDRKKRELDALDIEIAEIEEEIARAQRRREHVSVRRVAFGRRLQRCARTVGNLHSSGIAFEFHAAAAVELKRGETFDDAIKRERDVVVRLHADRGEVVAAPIPSAQAKALAAPRSSVCHRRETVRWTPCRARRAYLLAEIYPRPRNRSSDGFGLVAWLFKDQLIAALNREIDEDADDAHALSDAARAKRLAEIDAAILAAERREEG